MKKFIVYRMKYAKQLIKEGYELTGVAWDQKDSKYNVWFFINENGIEERLKELVEADKKQMC